MKAKIYKLLSRKSDIINYPISELLSNRDQFSISIHDRHRTIPIGKFQTYYKIRMKALKRIIIDFNSVKAITDLRIPRTNGIFIDNSIIRHSKYSIRLSTIACEKKRNKRV